MKKVEPITRPQWDAIVQAVLLLRDARDALASAGCPRAAKAVGKALKSAEGAERHALRRWARRDG